MMKKQNRARFTGNGFVFGAMAGILIGALIHPFGAGPGMVAGMAVGSLIELALWAQSRRHSEGSQANAAEAN